MTNIQNNQLVFHLAQLGPGFFHQTLYNPSVGGSTVLVVQDSSLLPDSIRMKGIYYFDGEWLAEKP